MYLSQINEKTLLWLASYYFVSISLQEQIFFLFETQERHALRSLKIKKANFYSKIHSLKEIFLRQNGGSWESAKKALKKINHSINTIRENYSILRATVLAIQPFQIDADNVEMAVTLDTCQENKEDHFSS